MAETGVTLKRVPEAAMKAAKEFDRGIATEFKGRLLQRRDPLADVSSLHEIEKPKVLVKEEYRNSWPDVTNAVMLAEGKKRLDRQESALLYGFIRSIKSAAKEARMNPDLFGYVHVDVSGPSKEVTEETAIRAGLKKGADTYRLDMSFLRTMSLKEATVLADAAGLDYKDKEKAESVVDTMITVWKDGGYPRYDDSGVVVAYYAEGMV